MLRKAGLVVFAVAVLGAGAVDTRAESCELDRPVKFADLNWASNAFHMSLAGYIMEHGYGCETTGVPGTTIPLVNGLGKGDVDVMMELWLDNVVQAWNKVEAQGKAMALEGASIPNAVQGWFVPRYVVEGDPERGIEAVAPDLRHVDDLPRYKSLFSDPEEPDKGRFHNCMLGWGCETVNTKKFMAYGLGEHFTNFRPGSGVALSAAIASAYKRGKPILAYYWGPTWVLGKYDMIMLEEPPYNKADWDALTASDDGAGMKATAFPVVRVAVAVNTEFAKEAPALVDFLRNYRTASKIVDEALVYMEENDDKTGRAAALNFLGEHEDLWITWVPDGVAGRVKASLQ